VKEVMSIMTGSLEKFSLPYMKQMAFTDSLTDYKTAIKVWESCLLALHQDCAALARSFGSSTKGPCNLLPLINGHEEWVPQRKMNLTVKEQKNLPLKLADNVLELARCSYSDLTDRVLSALFMLCIAKISE